jgi:hypothetical protein
MLVISELVAMWKEAEVNSCGTLPNHLLGGTTKNLIESGPVYYSGVLDEI